MGKLLIQIIHNLLDLLIIFLTWVRYYLTSKLSIYLLGHFFISQVLDSSRLPSQSLPSYCGVGLLHACVRVWVPSPQVSEHSPYSVQSPQPPLTEKVNKIAYYLLIYILSPDRYLVT